MLYEIDTLKGKQDKHTIWSNEVNWVSRQKRPTDYQGKMDLVDIRVKGTSSPKKG